MKTDKRLLLYQDEAGNKIIIDTDGKLCGLNADREMLNPESLQILLDQSRIKYKVGSKTGIYIWISDEK